MDSDFYILALDLSLSNTGCCIFDGKGIPLELVSIPTNSKDTHGQRLKIIADKLLEIRSKYNISIVVLEKGFTRFNTSTQTIFKVHGIANYIFYDCEQIYYAPSTIKKIVCGKGNADKDEVKTIIKLIFPSLDFKNNDESDAASIGYAYFLDNGVL